MLGFSETFKSFPGVLPASATTRRCSRQGPLDSDAEILTVDVVPTWEGVVTVLWEWNLESSS